MSAGMLAMRCDYCGLPTDRGQRLHPMCALEVSAEQFAAGPPAAQQVTSCPDGDPYCPACSPEPASQPFRGRNREEKKS